MMLNVFWNTLALQGGFGNWGGLVLPLGFLLIFYFIVWVPARRRQKDFQTMVEALKKGDRIVTTGGLYGEIVSVDTSTVILKIADSVKVKIAKSAIGSLEGEGDKGENR
ncbi:MAG TPA: preprotein translocase subunit YajC [Acidobacteria bacterium]|nr:preprotein translocase subunit YajC [Acidobacteriota bacterium]